MRRHDKGCLIAVRFALESGDPDAEAFLLHGLRHLDFSYRYVHPVATKEVMDLLAESVKTLHNLDHQAYQHEGKAFQDDASLAAALDPIAKLGSSMYTQLFGLGLNPESSDYSSDDIPRSDYARYGNCLRRWLTTTAALAVVSDRNFVPWNILYSKPRPASPDATDPFGFWAFGKRLQLMASGLCDFPEMRPEWRIAAGVESKDQRVQLGYAVHEKENHPFWTYASRVARTATLTELFHAFGDADILYFFGHASGSAGGQNFGRLDLHGEALTTIELQALLTLNKARVPAWRPLLVFLNGCESDVADIADQTFPGTLIRHRMNQFCVVSTIASVPAWSAAEFARRCLHSYLCSRKTLGESMAFARVSMLKEFKSPVGLFYATYGKLATIVGEAE